MKSALPVLLMLLAACDAPDPEVLLLPDDQSPGPVAFEMDLGAVVADLPLAFEANGLPPGAEVRFFGSRRLGRGPCAGPRGACLDIGGTTHLLATATADANGVAEAVIIAPIGMIDGTVWHFQAGAFDSVGRSAVSDIETRTVADVSVCFDAEARPRNPNDAEWSYHGNDDGPDDWGLLAGYGTCGGAGQAQTPIALDSTTATAGTGSLTFTNYDGPQPLDLLDNGHTLQVNVHTTYGPNDPQISDGTTTWFLKQFHVHSTSEHELDGESFPFEIHFVHESGPGGSLAVVGVFAEEGSPNTILDLLLADDPGHHMAASCTDALTLSSLLPASSAHFHYSGSLTTPPCSEGLDWFVLAEPITASWDQADLWQDLFHGTTNRPLQPVGGRVVTLNP